MASILKRMNPSGKIVYKVQFKDQYGQRHEIAAGPLKKHAEALLSRIMEEVNAGTYGNLEADPRFPDFCERFLQERKASLKHSTWSDYELTIRLYLVPYFGDKRLSQITPSIVQQIFTYLDESGLSPAYQGKILRNLKAILRYAYSMDMISSDPTKPIRAPRVQKKEIECLTPQEAAALINAAEGELKALLAVACYAGLRQGEILGLRWKDIDFSNGTIKVLRTYHANHGFTEPKTRSSKRAVPMPNKLQKMLEDYRTSLDGWHPEDLVFPNRAGNPMNRVNLVRRDFERTLEKAGIKRIRFHDLRHTYASLAIASGMDPKAIQQAMGHSSVRVTLDIYSHLYPGSYDRALERFDVIISHDM